MTSIHSSGEVLASAEDHLMTVGLLDALFPFRFEIELGSPVRIHSASPDLERWLSDELTGRPLLEHFTVSRPDDVELTADGIDAVADKTIIIEHHGTGRSIRGQFVRTSPQIALFAGSPRISGSDKLSDLELKLNDFAPHDASADLIVMAAVSAMRVADIERQHASLAEISAARDRADRSAATDPLTGVANRRALWARWNQLVDTDGKSTHSLIYIDIDGFKRINDDHGHSVGDEILRILSRRMTENLKAEDLVARLGGDEFALLLCDLDEHHMASVAERLQQAFTQPVSTSIGQLEVSVSMGVVSHGGTRSIDAVLRDADTAMHYGRMKSRGIVTFYDDQMGRERRAERELSNDLSVALETQQGLEPFFQPVIDLATRQITGFEALARWHHPDQGLIPPFRFIDLAERTGVIGALDRTILEQALATLAEWRRSHPNLVLHSNLSGRSLEPDLVPWIAQQLVRHGLPASALVLELTENWFVGDERRILLNELSDLGIKLQLDDFGTGYSSLSRLHAFPLSGLKIDRSFVSSMHESERDARLVEATIGLAVALELEIVAEGVECAVVADMLEELGCKSAQGYYFAKPLDGRGAERLLRQEHMHQLTP